MTNGELLAIISGQFGVLAVLLGWAGSRVFKKLDDLQTLNRETVKAISEGDKQLSAELRSAVNEVHDRVTRLGERVSRVEATCHVMHQLKAGPQ